MLHSAENVSHHAPPRPPVSVTLSLTNALVGATQLLFAALLHLHRVYLVLDLTSVRGSAIKFGRRQRSDYFGLEAIQHADLFGAYGYCLKRFTSAMCGGENG